MTRRALLLAVAIVCGAGAVYGIAADAAPRPARAQVTPSSPGLVREGRALFVDTCASCHGFDARGVRGRGPSLYGVGAQAADFYLSTGRMPLATSTDAPVRTHPIFSRGGIAALTAYVGSLGGPPIPVVDPARGDLAGGRRAFAEHCAGCHQILARGGIVVGTIAPSLLQSTPTQVAEAIRIGPYLMPRFDTATVDRRTLDSIARYVQWTKAPDNRGGAGLGNVGPVPEGLVAWLLGLAALLIVARLIGERIQS